MKIYIVSTRYCGEPEYKSRVFSTYDKALQYAQGKEIKDHGGLSTLPDKLYYMYIREDVLR